MEHKTLIFIGPQGSGKGTQGKIMVAKMGAEYIETGAMLRQIAKQNTEFGDHVKGLIENGKMVGDEDVQQIVKDRIKIIRPENIVIFDGIPRRVHQAEMLLEWLKEIGREQITTLHFDVPHEMSIKRLMLRRVCTICSRSAIANGDPNQKCEKCGGDLIIRKDDAPEYIQLRLDTYDKETVPVLDYLRDKTDFHKIDASQDIAHVAVDIQLIVRGQSAQG
jgi:adenylate kinase